MPYFHETRQGQRFYERQVPALLKVLERIAAALEGLVIANTINILGGETIESLALKLTKKED